MRNPIAILPNGVDLPVQKKLKAETLTTGAEGCTGKTAKGSPEGDMSRSEGVKAEIKTLLFLGRLHPKKGLIPALRAWPERAAMGSRGRALVEERFTWPKVAAQMKAVYERVLGGETKPSCVDAAGQIIGTRHETVLL